MISRQSTAQKRADPEDSFRDSGETHLLFQKHGELVEVEVAWHCVRIRSGDGDKRLSKVFVLEPWAMGRQSKEKTSESRNEKAEGCRCKESVASNTRRMLTDSAKIGSGASLLHPCALVGVAMKDVALMVVGKGLFRCVHAKSSH